MNLKLSLPIALSILLTLAACNLPAAPTTSPTAQPSPTEPPTATVAPTATSNASLATFDGASLSVPLEECDGAYTGLIQSVVATDAQTVTFTLCRPDPAFLFKMSLPAFGIYPKEWIQSTMENGARTSDALEHPVGTGPYQVSEWKRGESLTLTANPNYWDGAPATPTLIFRWEADPAARLADLEAGVVDGIDSDPAAEETIRSNSFLALYERPALTGLGFDSSEILSLLQIPASGTTAIAYRADVANPPVNPLGMETFRLAAPDERDTFTWLQGSEPASLFCADESDMDTLRACAQVTESLYRWNADGSNLEPALAESCEPNAEKTVWVCKLRSGVTFQDGSSFDAVDVVATFDMGLNVASPFHAGHENLWKVYDGLWGLLQRSGG